MPSFSDISFRLWTPVAAKVVGATVLSTALSIPAHAELISTQQASTETTAYTVAQPLAGLQQLLNREDVVRALQDQGVNVQDAHERLAALTDEEARQLQTDIESAPAGAGIIGAAVLVFLVLLATDITGHTDVFSFTRPSR